ncbi:MAG: DUF2384 domain-containing protein [Idiomarina sp.]|nr:DUF2384 domain-containing protein [Idiomarina sp.]
MQILLKYALSFYSSLATTVWLHTPLPALDGEAPFTLMSSQQGRARLREVLDAMRYGDLAWC